MTIKDILGKLEGAWESINEQGPGTLRSVAEKLHKTDVALFKAAEFLETPTAADAEAKGTFGVSDQKLQEVKADLQHLKEEMAAADQSSHKASKDASVQAMNPVLAALLAKLLAKVVEDLLERIG